MIRWFSSRQGEAGGIECGCQLRPASGEKQYAFVGRSASAPITRKTLHPGLPAYPCAQQEHPAPRRPIHRHGEDRQPISRQEAAGPHLKPELEALGFVVEFDNAGELAGGDTLAT